MKRINQNDHMINASRNAFWGIIGQLFAYLLRFATRIIFTKTLSVDYLGIEGLFTNIISVLSLAELGFGSAIVFNMYKPIAEEDNPKILGLLHYYKRVYSVIGIIVFVIGFSFAPFLQILVKEMPAINHIRLYYCMFVLQSGLSYFYAYKRSFLIANQQNYLVSIIHYLLETIYLAVEAIALIIWKQYIVYLSLTILQVITENIIVSFVCDRYYPFIKENNKYNIDPSTRKEIKRNVSALVIHQFGSVAVNSTDNIIISRLIGIIETGLYSNYSLVISAVNGIVGQFFSGITASLGHINASNNTDYKIKIFWQMFLLNHLIYGLLFCCLSNLINDFIVIAFGDKYLIDNLAVLLVLFSFYINGMRKTNLLYKSTMGIFRPDRYKAFFEALINLIVSIYAARKIGLTGVFLGTVVSCLTTSFWVEPYVVFKHGFHTNCSKYFVKYIYNLSSIIISSLLCCYILKRFVVHNILQLFIKAILVAIISSLLLVIMYLKDSEFITLRIRFTNFLYRIIKHQ